ncbi:MAG: hypothetical protein J6V36_01490 [Clostridia bacterium]|nr:hypothetical protein [Clostridia bacterium]
MEEWQKKIAECKAEKEKSAVPEANEKNKGENRKRPFRIKTFSGISFFFY